MQIIFKTNIKLSLVLLSLFGFQCTADQLPEPKTAQDCDAQSITYESEIQYILETNCAYSGCHLDSAPGVYTTYEGVLGVLGQGSFLERVVTLRDDPILGMPPDFVPSNRPTSLSEEELRLIRCWLEAGFPEK